MSDLTGHRGNQAAGVKPSPTYRSWAGAVSRCINPNAVAYPDYGGRGIRVCERWRQFENFLADMGEKPIGLTLDRIDPNGNYEPSNCRWASRLVQAQNQRRTRLSFDLADEIRERRRAGATIPELSRSYQLGQTSIRHVLYGSRWVRPGTQVEPVLVRPRKETR